MHAKFRSREIKLTFYQKLKKTRCQNALAKIPKPGFAFPARWVPAVALSLRFLSVELTIDLSSAPTRLFKQLKFIVFGLEAFYTNFILKMKKAACGFCIRNKISIQILLTKHFGSKRFPFWMEIKICVKIRRKNWPLLKNWKKGTPRGILVGDGQLWNSVKWISTWETMEGRKCFDFTSEERRLLEGTNRRRFRRGKECGKVLNSSGRGNLILGVLLANQKG